MALFRGYCFATAGFVVMSFLLWLPMFVIDTIRHAIARAGSHDR